MYGILYEDDADRFTLVAGFNSVEEAKAGYNEKLRACYVDAEGWPKIGGIYIVKAEPKDFDEVEAIVANEVHLCRYCGEDRQDCEEYEVPFWVDEGGPAGYEKTCTRETPPKRSWNREE